MSKRNAIYAQSGGVTAVINATASGLIEAARSHRDRIGKVLAGRNGIIGVLREELIDTSKENRSTIQRLRETPGGAFGSCRYKLTNPTPDDPDIQRLFEVFAAHDVGYFFYNGGGDSQDTANKVSKLSQQLSYPVQCIGIPKTVDNDLSGTDNCPGFGSVAKYVAISTKEAALDVASMSESSTKVFILEVMGRHAGWIAASGGLAGEGANEPPHLILFPEAPFDSSKFLAKVEATVGRIGYCVIVASEGVQDGDGNFLSDAETTDAFGHAQLGGVAPVLANLVKEELGLKYHYAVADYLQRSSRHIASRVDVEQAYAVGRGAIAAVAAGKDDIMIGIERLQDKPYRWRLAHVNLSKVANIERKVPRSFRTKDEYGITARARRYLQPLIRGEAYPAYRQGMPRYAQTKNQLVAKKLRHYEVG
ncbi:MAG: 6-phosphofructokinase [Gammaproteobacteria bacterium]|nr:6-phosphofructokinase [Gammaproteobacteria bacterium]